MIIQKIFVRDGTALVLRGLAAQLGSASFAAQVESKGRTLEVTEHPGPMLPAVTLSRPQPVAISAS